MTRFSWNNEVWEQISDYAGVWASFDSRFHFHPGMAPSKWPAIEEPAGSVTIDLSLIFARDESGFGAAEVALNDLVLDALLEAFPPETRLLALDWHHPAYPSQAWEGEASDVRR